MWFEWLLLILTVAFGLDLGFGVRRVRSLTSIPPAPGRFPRVSIVVAARNEERAIGETVSRLLAQDYPAFDVIVVNDRSEDRTGAILDAIAARDARLRVVHVSELPPGWLGKNHALDRGAALATAEYLLFADGDVQLDPTVLARVVQYCEANHVDHLAVAPRLIMPSALLEAYSLHFLVSFLSFAKPWKVRDRRSRYFIGIGAFNFVRTEAYRAVGGHRTISLRPDDDIKLGKLLKRSGFRQDALRGQDLVTVEWYHRFSEMVAGFEKNMFAGLDYRVSLSIAAGLGQLLFGVAPILITILSAPDVRWLLVFQIGALAATFATVARWARLNPLLGLSYPIGTVLFVYVLWRTMFLNLSERGLRWRGTFYSLDELRANKID